MFKKTVFSHSYGFDAAQHGCMRQHFHDISGNSSGGSPCDDRHSSQPRNESG